LICFKIRVFHDSCKVFESKIVIPVGLDRNTRVRHLRALALSCRGRRAIMKNQLAQHRLIKERPPSAPDERSRGEGGRLLRKTAVELVEDELRARIMSGALLPGAALRQEALSAELGVSRIPIREAIRLLSSEGLVDLVPHKGAYVSIISKDEVQDLFAVRWHLEPWLIAEATLRISDAELDQAARIAQRMDNVDAEQWGALNWELHEHLYRAANRPTAMNILRSLHEKTERYLRFQVVNAPIRQQAHAEHLALIELCRNRHADQAKLALEQHINDAANHIIDIVARLLDAAVAPKTA
jgi:DNA-binding GntR family transcriptional regulator